MIQINTNLPRKPSYSAVNNRPTLYSKPNTVPSSPQFGENFLGPLETGLSILLLLPFGLLAAGVIGGAYYYIRGLMTGQVEKKVNPQLFATASSLRSQFNEGQMTTSNVNWTTPKKVEADLRIDGKTYHLSIENHAQGDFDFQPTLEAVRDDKKVALLFDVDSEMDHGIERFTGQSTFTYGSSDRPAQKTTNPEVTNVVLHWAKDLYDSLNAMNNKNPVPTDNPFGDASPLEM